MTLDLPGQAPRAVTGAYFEQRAKAEQAAARTARKAAKAERRGRKAERAFVAKVDRAAYRFATHPVDVNAYFDGRWPQATRSAGTAGWVRQQAIRAALHRVAVAVACQLASVRDAIAKLWDVDEDPPTEEAIRAYVRDVLHA